MLYKQSLLGIADNSGAKVLKTIRVVNKLKFGKVGDLILVTLLKFLQGKKVKKKTFYLGLIVSVKY